MNSRIAFLLQTNYVIRLTTPVAWYARHNGYDVIECFMNEQRELVVLGDLSQYDLVVPYGSIKMMREFCKLPAGHHIQYAEDGMDATLWMKHFGELALNYAGQSMLAGDVSAYLELNSKAHVRPQNENKAFIAKLFDKESWREHAEQYRVRAELPVFVSPPREIIREYRTWVIAGKVVEVSQYIEHSKLSLKLIEDGPVHEAAQRLADIYLPGHAVSLDVAETPEGYRLIEFNPFQSCGWYEGRVDRIFDHYLADLLGRLKVEPPKKPKHKFDWMGL
ncbi:ATP-grasp domain-containing protein [Pseudomonas aeruginosa]